MRISDWSSDVCSSDLPGNHRLFALEDIIAVKREYTVGRPGDVDDLDTLGRQPAKPAAVEDCDLRIARGRTIHHQTIRAGRSEEHTSELQSLMRISYAVFCLKKKKKDKKNKTSPTLR